MSDIVFKLVKTPNPYELGLAVHVRDTLLANNPQLFPSQSRKYTDFVQSALTLVAIDQSYARGFGDYYYVDFREGFMGGEQPDQFPTIILNFTKHKTDAQKSVPFRATTTFGNHYWHPILDALAFIEDRNFPRFTSGGRGGKSAIITGPTYYVREIYRPSVNEGSRFLKEEFFADSAFDIPPYPVPVPTSVSYDLPGVRGTFPECLHPEIIIPTTQTANASFVLGDQGAAGGTLPGQKFPETNFTDRVPYVVSDQQEFQNGWYRTRITVFPPVESEDEIIR